MTLRPDSPAGKTFAKRDRESKQEEDEEKQEEQQEEEEEQKEEDRARELGECT